MVVSFEIQSAAKELITTWGNAWSFGHHYSL